MKDLAIDAQLGGRPGGPDICRAGHVGIVFELAGRVNFSKDVVSNSLRIEYFFGWSLDGLNFSGEFLPGTVVDSNCASSWRRRFCAKAPRLR